MRIKGRVVTTASLAIVALVSCLPGLASLGGEH